MNLNNIFLSTLITELPRILRHNFSTIQSYFNLFYDGSLGVITVPINTPGKIKASTGEFVTTITDDLVVKNQWTNLYENITTIDSDYYNMYNENPAIVRDASVGAGENPTFKYIDVLSPYYKLDNINPRISFKTNMLGKMVEIIFNNTSSVNNYEIRLNNTQVVRILNPDIQMARLQLICVGIPNVQLSIFDNTWFIRNYSGNISII